MEQMRKLSRPLRFFEAWNASMATLNAAGARHAQAEMQMRKGEDAPQAMAKQVASTEVVRTIMAMDMIDIAKSMARSKTGLAEMQSLVPARRWTNGSTGSPDWKAILDLRSLGYTEFLFGDCVPLLKRDTPVSAQQIFDALPGIIIIIVMLCLKVAIHIPPTPMTCCLPSLSTKTRS